MNPERNDVDVSKLFSWGRVFELDLGNDESLYVYMRILGDADLNKTRVHALRESAKLRKLLRNTESDERIISIRDKEELTKENLVDYNVLFATRDLTQRIWKSVKIPVPKTPKSDASLEEQEKYQKEVDEYPSKRGEAVKKALKEEVDKLREDLNSKSEDELYNLYVKSVVNELCEQRSIQAFKEYSTYMGCYKDDTYKEKFFDSFEQFMNLETEQKMEFMSAYDTLEMGTEEIKKLREATL